MVRQFSWGNLSFKQVSGQLQKTMTLYLTKFKSVTRVLDGVPMGFVFPPEPQHWTCKNIYGDGYDVDTCCHSSICEGGRVKQQKTREKKAAADIKPTKGKPARIALEEFPLEMVVIKSGPRKATNRTLWDASGQQDDDYSGWSCTTHRIRIRLFGCSSDKNDKDSCLSCLYSLPSSVARNDPKDKSAQDLIVLENSTPDLSWPDSFTVSNQTLPTAKVSVKMYDFWSNLETGRKRNTRTFGWTGKQVKKHFWSGDSLEEINFPY